MGSTALGAILSTTGMYTSTDVDALLPIELAYTQFTSDVSITATTESGANTVVTAAAISFDGATNCLIEFFTPQIDRGTTFTAVYLFQDGSSIGKMCGSTFTGGGGGGSWQRRMTPASGSRTYSIRASVDAGTGTVYGGTGGATKDVPGFIRITRI